jgi:hypothetical protein
MYAVIQMVSLREILFLKHSNKEGGVLRKYLLRALEFKGITLSDYKILVAAKKIRAHEERLFDY